MDAIEQLQEDVREGRIDLDRLIDVIGMLQRQLEAARQELEAAKQRIEELEKKSANPTPPAAGSPGKIEQPFSMRAEEKRQRQRGKSDKLKLSRNGRRGRLSTADKLKRAERTREVFSRRRAARRLSPLAHAAGVAAGRRPGCARRLRNLSRPQEPIRQDSRRAGPQRIRPGGHRSDRLSWFTSSACPSTKSVCCCSSCRICT